MQDVLSTIIAGAVCVAVAYAVAYCFPSKEMLDAEAVDREWTPPAAAQCTSGAGCGAGADDDATR